MDLKFQESLVLVSVIKIFVLVSVIKMKIMEGWSLELVFPSLFIIFLLEEEGGGGREEEEDVGRMRDDEA